MLAAKPCVVICEVSLQVPTGLHQEREETEDGLGKKE